MSKREIHSDFAFYLEQKEGSLVQNFIGLRDFVLDICPACCELIYHTHALTAVFSITGKLGDAFCMIPIYSKHFNLGFNRGTLLNDPKKLLQGTGKWIRHIPIATKADYDRESVRQLILDAIDLAKMDVDFEPKSSGKTISKIKK